MSHNARTWGLLVLLILCTAAAAQSLQVIYLKDGSTIRGNVVDQDANTLLVETEYGKLEVPKANVLRIEYATSVVTPQPQTTLPGVMPGQTAAGQFHAKPKKEPCLGCFFSWLIPGAGMLYAEEGGWAAGYFFVGVPLMIWTYVEVSEAGPYGEPDYTPLLILVPIRIVEYIHTYAVIDGYNKRYGWAANYDRAVRTASIEYRFAPIDNEVQPALALDFPADRNEVRAGIKVRF